MSAFKFDAYAELAKIQNRNPAPAAVATPATVEAKIQLQVETIAGVAGVAGVAGIAGGHAGNEERSCQIADLFERIGIMCENGGRAAYDAAAQDQEYGSFDHAISQILEGWLDSLHRRSLICAHDARANWHQVEIADRHGWSEIELFGRYSGLIVRLNGAVIRQIHQSYATTCSGAIYARTSRPGEWPIWEEEQ